MMNALLPNRRMPCLSGLLMCLLCALGLLASVSSHAAEAVAPGAKLITDIAHWQHPTHAVFDKYHASIQQVSIDHHFATFTVALPFDPQTAPNAHKLNQLCLELLEANGNWDYALALPADHVVIRVSWDKKHKQATIDMQALDAPAKSAP